MLTSARIAATLSIATPDRPDMNAASLLVGIAISQPNIVLDPCAKDLRKAAELDISKSERIPNNPVCVVKFFPSLIFVSHNPEDLVSLLPLQWKGLPELIHS